MNHQHIRMALEQVLGRNSFRELEVDDMPPSKISFTRANITPLQIMRLAYAFQTEPNDISLNVAYEFSPTGTPWWLVRVKNIGKANWEWKP